VAGYVETLLDYGVKQSTPVPPLSQKSRPTPSPPQVQLIKSQIFCDFPENFRKKKFRTKTEFCSIMISVAQKESKRQAKPEVSISTLVSLSL
jgi:hypothetical protein